MKLQRVIVAVGLLAVVTTFAATQGGRRQRTRDSAFSNASQFPTARDAIANSANSADYPDWEYDPRFQKDVFTFVRMEYDVDPQNPGHAGMEHSGPSTSLKVI